MTDKWVIYQIGVGRRDTLFTLGIFGSRAAAIKFARRHTHGFPMKLRMGRIKWERGATYL